MVLTLCIPDFGSIELSCGLSCMPMLHLIVVLEVTYLMQELSRQAYKTAICQMTHLFLSRASKGELERAVLPSAKLFVDAVIVPFLLLLLGSEVVGCDRSA